MKKAVAFAAILAAMVFVGGCGDKLYKDCVEKSMKFTEQMFGGNLPEEAKAKAQEAIEQECKKCKNDKKACEAQLKQLDTMLQK